MEKQKKIYVITLSTFALLLLATIVLFAVKVINTLFFVVAFSIIALLIVLNIFMLVRVIKKLKSLQVKKEDIKTSGDYNTDLYGLLGIPLQYNKDGSVKDIYELLGIMPEYDENGKRILTIYEMLGIAPKFNEKGEEIPLVFVIKNGVKRIAKVDLSSRVLTRKLTEEEKEALIIKETLQKKLSEAQETGDKQKEEAIKKVLKTEKKQVKKDSEYKPVKYTVGKSGGPVKFGSIGNFDAVKVSWDDLFDLFKKAAASPKHVKPQKEEEKKIEPKKMEGQTVGKVEPLKKESNLLNDKQRIVSLDIVNMVKKEQKTKDSVSIDIFNELER